MKSHTSQQRIPQRIDLMYINNRCIMYFKENNLWLDFQKELLSDKTMKIIAPNKTFTTHCVIFE